MLTPGQFTARSEFYHQLGQLISAGLGLIPALRQLERSPPARSYREPIRQLLGRLAQGQTFSEALRQAGAWLPEFDVSLIQAGEKSGRLEQSFRLLSGYYGDRARIMKQMLGDLAYPAFLLHFAVLLFPVISNPRRLLNGDLLFYAGQVLLVLIPLYAVIGLAVYALQSKRSLRWRGSVEAVLHRVPILGSGRRCLALARLSAALEALLSAGVNIIESWEMAAASSGSAALSRTVAKWRPLLDAGQTPAELVATSSCFPRLFSDQYSTGEISGRLDEVLRRLHDYYDDEGTRKIRAVAKWAPTAIYLGIVLVIGYRIIVFWMGYFQQIQNAIGG